MLAVSALLRVGDAFGAEQFATRDEARAVLDRAIVAPKANERAALKALKDEKDKDFRDRDLYVFCFSLQDGNLPPTEPIDARHNVRELKLGEDAISRRAYDVVAKAAEGEVVPIDFNFQKPDHSNPRRSSHWKHALAIKPAR